MEDSPEKTKTLPSKQPLLSSERSKDARRDQFAARCGMRVPATALVGKWEAISLSLLLRLLSLSLSLFS